MKCRYVLIGFLILCSAACSNKEKIEPNPGGNGNDNGQPLNIEMALMTRPSLIKTHSSDPALMNQLVAYLNSTPKGSVIHISIYQFNDGQVIDALKDAYNRGVEIHLMIDSGKAESRTSNINTYPVFRSLLQSPSEMVVTNNDVTTTAINHEKYVLFSEVDLPDGVAKNLVFATSHNFTTAATKKVQDAVIMTNKDLYNAFLDNWSKVAARAQQGMKDFTYQEFNIGDSITACFFPRRENGVWDGKDNIVDALSKLSDYSKDTISVFMAFWDRVGIAQKLTELQKAGATVQVITREDGGQGVSSAVMAELHKLKDAGGYVKILDINKENDHSKCMLIKGVFDGKQQEIILTGSHNYTKGALEYNSEFLLMLENSTLFSSYWNYFKTLQSTLDDFSGWGD